MSRFEPINGRSELALEGNSSMHPLHASTDEITGYFEATLDEDGRIDLSEPVSGQVEVPVESMNSENALIDRELRSRLDTRRFPKATAKLLDVHQGEMGHYRASGEITFHGVTLRLEDEFVFQQQDERTIELRGEITIDVRNFKVNPPKLLMLKIFPEVKVKLHLVLERVDE